MIRPYAAFEPRGNLRPFTYDPGPLREHEVEVDVRYCGVCQGDVNLIDNTWGTSRYPAVPGHEIVGTIAGTGTKVTGLRVGQTVGLGWYANFCNDCDYCRAGDHNLCTAAEATIIGRHGGFADKVRAGASSVFPLPDHLDLESAAPLFCAGITVFNPLLQFGVRPRDKVAVIGIGGLGHLALQFFKAWGCEVTAFTFCPAKAHEALRMGARHVLNSCDQHDIASAAGRFDFILSTASAQLNWNLYLRALKPRGRLHFVGVTPKPLEISVSSLVMGQRSMSGSSAGSPSTVARMLEFCNLHGIEPVVDKLPFDAVNEAVARLRSGDARYRIVLYR